MAIKRKRDGTFKLELSPDERAILADVPTFLRELLTAEEEDASTVRLFPPAYRNDDERDADYQRLVRDDLVASRLAAVDLMEQTIASERLSEEELAGWLSALNATRLVLGTRLGVTEDWYEDGLPDDDPRAGAFALYGYLGWLEEQAVEALAGGLPRG